MYELYYQLTTGTPQCGHTLNETINKELQPYTSLDTLAHYYFCTCIIIIHTIGVWDFMSETSDGMTLILDFLVGTTFVFEFFLMISAYETVAESG